MRIKLNLRYDYIISKENPLGTIAECYQRLANNIEYASVDNDLKIIQFTSTIPSEGKTTTIGNLTYVCQEKGKRVLVIDLDFRRPKIHRIFSTRNEVGMTDYLVGKADKKQIINKSEYGAHFITAGASTTAVVQLISSQKLKDFLAEIRKEYDYVFIDSAPTYSVSDSTAISSLVDGTLFVVGKGMARKTVVKDAISQLKYAKANIIGIVCTQFDGSSDTKYLYKYSDK